MASRLFPMALRIGFVGAGKVGCSLGRLFLEGGLTVSGYCSRSVESCRAAAAFTDSVCFTSLDDLVRASDALILTVPDGAIGEVWEQLRGLDLAGKQICQCSGSLTAAEAFPGISETGATGYSLHPLFPVSSKWESYRELRDAWFSIEGDALHLSEWKARLEALGPHVQVIGSESKQRYHAACVISSNLVCGLVAESISLLSDCGFSEETALTALAPLMLANMEHLIESGPVGALTGPIERNDASTVEGHLDCFEDDEARELYRLASLRLLEVAWQKHPEHDQTRLRELLGTWDTPPDVE